MPKTLHNSEIFDYILGHLGSKILPKLIEYKFILSIRDWVMWKISFNPHYNFLNKSNNEETEIGQNYMYFVIETLELYYKM